LQVFLKREHPPLDLLVQLLNQRVQFIDVPQLGLEHQPLVRADQSFERALEIRFLVLQTPKCQLRQGFRINVTGYQRFDHRTRRFAQNIAGYRRQFDVGAFQHFLNPVDFSCPLLDQTTAVSDQLAKLPLITRRNEAASEQSMPEQR